MPETAAPAVDFSADADLISFLKAIPDGRYRRGVRYLVVPAGALLGILSDCRSSRDLEAFAKRHRGALNQALDLNFKRWPTDATFLSCGPPGCDLNPGHHCSAPWTAALQHGQPGICR